MHRANTRRLRLAAAASALAFLANGLIGSAAGADTPAGSWSVSANTSSDPFVTYCYIKQPDNSVATDLCMYTSQDMTTGNYQGNDYPMSATHLYVLSQGSHPNGTWTDQGPVLNESTYTWAGTRTGNQPANHLWAPTMALGGYNGGLGYYLYAPDVTDAGVDGVHKTSQIGVSVASDPRGPFNYQKRITFNGSNLTGYMSDPAVMQTMGFDTRTPPNGASRWLAWADGDFYTCGGLSVAQLDESDMSSLVTAPAQISITNLPAGLNSCTRQLPPGVAQGTAGYSGTVNHAYMEGPELYFMNVTGAAPFGDTFMLTFAIKPNSNPTGCSSTNEALAYATGNDPRGPFTYRGIIMCGSSTAWTNQGSIYGFWGSNGARFMLFYHDSNTSTFPENRRVHAECLNISSTGITTANRTTTFDSCLGSDWSLWTSAIPFT